LTIGKLGVSSSVWALGVAVAAIGLTGAQGPSKPEDNRFTPVVLVPGGELDEPMAFEVLRDERVLVIERKGVVKLVDPVAKTVKRVATIAVNTKYTSAEGVVTEAEEGLMGLAVDPNFDVNHWVYILYSHPTEKKFVLARWELAGDTFVAGSEKALLEYATQREVCCHTGGGMVWDEAGNLYLGTGNNTGNLPFSSTDERPDRSSWDDQRSSANTNDLRGKILRIHPEPDGTYTIPPGNLFPPGTAGTRPEIYTMGHRNPWRLSRDSKTGFLYWGEIGPDAGEDTDNVVRGYDEFNQARGPGNFGWPYFSGDNFAYPLWDYESSQGRPKRDPARPVNASPNNTGLRELPPAQPAMIYYPYGVSDVFPEVGTGSRCAIGGPIYRRQDRPNAARPFPDYFEGKWLAADLSRNWIMTIAMDENGRYRSMERFLPAYRPVEIIDMKFGPNGDLYLLEYGSNWFRKSDDTKLVRVEYNAGNRAPVPQVSASRLGGSVPLQVTLSSAGTRDFDGDALTYQWRVEELGGAAPRTFTGASPVVRFDTAGVFDAILTVTDPAGAAASRTVTIVAGNEPPLVSVNVSGNQTFFFPTRPIAYDVQVRDREDGTTARGSIRPSQVAFSIDYVPEGFDVASIRQDGQSVDAVSKFAVARALVAKSDCKACHNVDSTNQGPAFTEIAAKYRPDRAALEKLTTKIRTGGTGVWGDKTMPPHAGLSVHESRLIARYILGVSDTALRAVPLAGSHLPAIPAGDNARGSWIFRAVYTDRGVKDIPPITTDAVVVRRSGVLSPGAADVIHGAATRVEGNGAGPVAAVPTSGAHLGFTRLHLTGIGVVEIQASTTARENHVGGTIEVRVDRPDGPLAGRAVIPAPGATPRGRGGPPAARIPLKLAGTHDLYFVFRNDTAAPNAALMVVTAIRFAVQ
jgi:cytochrome c